MEVKTNFPYWDSTDVEQSEDAGGLILHAIQIEGTSIIESVIDGLSRNNLGGVMQGLNTLYFAPLVWGKL